MNIRRFTALLLVFLCVPTAAFAAQSVTRRDGFLMIWSAIQRPALPAWTAFDDLPEDARGSLEIDYAVDRGLIDEADLFHPDDPLTVADAQLWLIRTRNIEPRDEAGDVLLSGIPDPEHVPALAAFYGIDALSPDHALTSDELLDMMRTLDARLAAEEHETSLYSEKFHGKGTAFGESFDMHAMTAAHRTFPANTLVRVTNVDNDKSVVVRINDRGPFVQGRDMDLSLGAFTSIADRSKGKIMARYERLGDAVLANACTGVDRFQKRITRDVLFHWGVPHTLPLGQSLSLTSDQFFVVRGITYPGAKKTIIQDIVAPGESFSLTPSIEGEYRLIVGTTTGRRREMRMQVRRCD